MLTQNPIDLWGKVTAERKKPLWKRALGLVAAYKSAVTGSYSFDEARSHKGSDVVSQNYDGLPIHRYVNYTNTF
jgi:hypothetical protein